jgi:CheY-like chemotaxis protein
VAKQQGLYFSVELEPGLPRFITTDASRLRQVLKNLVSNAFKFTERGGVSMRLGVVDRGWSPENDSLRRAGEAIAISVTDTGIGITTEEQQLIFEAFAQADGSTVRQYGGTGLGLSISRELVRLLGGEIALTSTLGAGSTFTVFLPRSPVSVDRWASSLGELPVGPLLEPAGGPPPEAVHVRSNGDGAAGHATELQSSAGPVFLPPAANGTGAVIEQPSRDALAGMKVMVVDDDSRNVFAIAALLKRLRVEVVSAESGEEGIALLKESPDVNLVLMDIMMPGMDGYATMRAMRELPSGARVPLIAFTAKVADGERQRCLDAGASAYIPKPIDTAHLINILGRWLPAGTDRTFDVGG